MFSQQESNLRPKITSSDALPRSYRRLVGAKAIKLGSCDNILHIARILMSMCGISAVK